ncbi:calaxin-like isoform X2 [Paramacrobiotus metropolitanus]|uniref:calaxin-like isoform X2 n=1 Tax=Paramacrobiotus metropolitanus TaxID=2943436 RepID=UPI002445BB81|nr:calaxin-like isoform X2 [Paramacrobiotus metropolitanus]
MMDKDKTTSTNLLSQGVTLDDFWMLSKKPYLTKDGVYKKPEHGENDALAPQNLKLYPTEEDEERRQPPRLVILKSEVDRFIDSFYPHSELQKNETRALVDLFFEHAKKPKGYMTKTQFKRFIFGTLDMYDAFLCERMFIIFDKNKDELIDYQEWTHGMHTILVGSIHEQMKYCFLAYDLRGKGQLESEDIKFWIKRSYYNLNPMTDSQKAEFYEDIYRLIMNRIAHQKDDYITFKKYRTAVCDNPSLMQLIGAVLPDPEIVWKVNDMLFPRFFRSQHLMLFPRGDVPTDRGIKPRWEAGATRKISIRQGRISANVRERCKGSKSTSKGE